MELTIAQAAIVGFVAVILTQGIKIFFNWINKPIDRRVVTIAVYIPAVVMAVYWAQPAMPVFPVLTDDPAIFVSVFLSYAGELLVVAASVAGFAMTIYNLGMDTVLKKLGYNSVD